MPLLFCKVICFGNLEPITLQTSSGRDVLSLQVISEKKRGKILKQVGFLSLGIGNGYDCTDMSINMVFNASVTIYVKLQHIRYIAGASVVRQSKRQWCASACRRFINNNFMCLGVFLNYFTWLTLSHEEEIVTTDLRKSLSRICH